eukprot:TRINITY_DN30855_c0_g1_i1.p1 TRINITY_DN30855_c0_g1~~TRINITY_DN30855_c0_g1_i1.p1  ORF type:complete len:844 (+),score=287.70 TRINITY_DN30855_c0_g1_i1:95-2626(+)
MSLGDGVRACIKVYVRVRPPHAGEDESCVSWTSGEDGAPDTIRIQQRLSFESQEYPFDKVLGTDCGQLQVFDTTCVPLLEDVLKGHLCTLMAYGQTGTGKTHTLSNVGGEDGGIIPRALAWLFERTGPDDDVSLQYVEIYKEQLHDLLADGPDPGQGREALRVRQGEDGLVTLSGAVLRRVSSAAEACRVVRQGDRVRQTGLTKMNASSSRSHACLMLSVTRTVTESGAECAVRGKITLVDLAGSERVAKTGSAGERLQEAKFINLSLTTLGNVVAALIDEKASYVPYRESNLTRLLQDSLGGVGKTSVIVTVGPDMSNAHESSNSCLFGQRAMKVSTTSRVHRVEDWRAKALRLEKQLAEAQEEAEGLRVRLAAATRQQDGAGRAERRGSGQCRDSESPGRTATIRENFELKAQVASLTRKVELLETERAAASSDAATAASARAEADALRQELVSASTNAGLLTDRVASLRAELAAARAEADESGRRAAHVAAAASEAEVAAAGSLRRAADEAASLQRKLSRAEEAAARERESVRAAQRERAAYVLALERTIEQQEAGDTAARAEHEQGVRALRSENADLQKQNEQLHDANQQLREDLALQQAVAEDASDELGTAVHRAEAAEALVARVREEATAANADAERLRNEAAQQSQQELTESVEAAEQLRKQVGLLARALGEREEEMVELQKTAGRAVAERVKEQERAEAAAERWAAERRALDEERVAANGRRDVAIDAEERWRTVAERAEQRLSSLTSEYDSRLQQAFAATTESVDDGWRSQRKLLLEEVQRLKAETDMLRRERVDLLVYAEKRDTEIEKQREKRAEVESRLSALLSQQAAVADG